MAFATLSAVSTRWPSALWSDFCAGDRHPCPEDLRGESQTRVTVWVALREVSDGHSHVL